MIVAAFISDRPPELYFARCLESFKEYVDSGGGWPMPRQVFCDHDHLLGMAGNVRAAWEWALSTGAEHLFHCEEDFLFTASVPLAEMATILDNCPHLSQLVLKRQPWSDAEKQAGGQIETNPDAYTQCAGWVEHETLFSMNPCLIPRRTLELVWSTDHPGGVERAITEACLDKGMRFAYYGHRDDPPRCEHVGHQRSTGWRW